jgi:glutamine synthetase
MFGYSITRPVHNQDYYYGIFNTCAQFNCGIEGWHTESGPGVFEAVRHLISFSLPIDLRADV